MTGACRVFVVVGSPGSGKDILIRAVHDLGAKHALMVPKHTSRGRRDEDGPEMICPGDPGHDLESCTITYENYEDRYGIVSNDIWQGLQRGVSQVLVVSNVEAINRLRAEFGAFLSLIYVHSERNAAKYEEEEKVGDDDCYVQRRALGYDMASRVYLSNFLAFDHVVIYSGTDEDLYDQVFRLFRALKLSLISF